MLCTSSGTPHGWAGISGFGSKLGGMMADAGSAVAGFVSKMGGQLLTAAKATGVWIAERAVATAGFIAQNIAQAASATAAFIAENAATLGLVVGIGALVAAVVRLATHWHQAWDGIEDAALFIWHRVLDPMWQGIEKGAEWLYKYGIKPYFDSIKLEFKLLEAGALWLWHNVFDPVWHGIEAGARNFMSAFGTIWKTVESVFKTPVNFLIGTVYDNGIRRFWNDIAGDIGLGSLKLPEIPKLATRRYRARQGHRPRQPACDDAARRGCPHTGGRAGHRPRHCQRPQRQVQRQQRLGQRRRRARRQGRLAGRSQGRRAQIVR